MQYKIKTFRKYNIDRSDLFKITYQSPQELKPSTSCEVRRQQYNKKFTTEIENEDDPPTQIIDLSKLPNGQFKDRRYMHTDETFFVKMGGKNRDLIAEKLRSKQTDRQSPFKFKENPFFNQNFIKQTLKLQKNSSPISSKTIRTSQTKLSFLQIIDIKPVTIKEQQLRRASSFTSAKQKLFKILTEKS
ncbi:unnamed protein product [Paramecium primaurelia]|uniref:Uncharacterized protein n=1 Tax=Paramecium primaurelia TaxID=5886 RepID=A0A8S1M3Q2_PARPR|nr:unnamed protein product [Paramecium primaurelia]